MTPQDVIEMHAMFEALRPVISKTFRAVVLIADRSLIDPRDLSMGYVPNHRFYYFDDWKPARQFATLYVRCRELVGCLVYEAVTRDFSTYEVWVPNNVTRL